MSKEEFAVLAEKYMDTIYRVAYSWTKNSDDANDVTQDVLIQLYKTTKEFESDSHLKSSSVLYGAKWRTSENMQIPSDLKKKVI